MRYLVCLLTATFVVLATVTMSKSGPLKDYVDQVDPSYSYELVASVKGFGYTGYVLSMTSLSWRSASEVNRTLWTHWVTVVVPTFVWRDKALLAIAAADHGSPHDPDVIDYLAAVAVPFGTVAVLVEMVPNQPLLFNDETTPRSSDAIIAYSWNKFCTTDDPTWIAQFPMTKAVVRAMDTVQDFCAVLDSPVSVDSFIVTGGSKHGWISWLTGVVDDRVAAIIPVVIDLLNLEQSFKHHFAAYGFWAPAVHDYEEMGIFGYVNSPEIEALEELIDPYSFRNQLTLPRFLVNAAGDEFFLPDSSRLYYRDLLPPGRAAGGKYLRYIPNSGHSLDLQAALTTISTYLHALLSGDDLPEFSWSTDPDGAIRVQTGAQKPSSVKLWQATNPTSRDFRLTTIGAAWTSTQLTDLGGGLYLGGVSSPATGWTGYFVELSYPSSRGIDYTFTTEVHVLPTFLPYAADIDFDGEIEGDVDGDSRVELNDAVLALQVVSGEVSQATKVEADIDGDRRLGLADIIYILDYNAASP